MKMLITDRRRFFADIGRTVLLGVIAACAAILFGKRRGSGLQGQKCGGDGICRGCDVLGRCGLPQALSVKRDGKQGEDVSLSTQRAQRENGSDNE